MDVTWFEQWVPMRNVLRDARIAETPPENISTPIHVVTVDVIVSNDIPVTPSSDFYFDHLAVIRTRCDEIIEHLERTASLACSTESSARHSYSTQEAIVAEFHEDYYDRLDPVGAAVMLQENKMIENRFCEAEVNYLGDLLVGSPPGRHRSPLNSLL